MQSELYNPVKTLFYNFGFDGERTTRGSSVDGINFRLPSHLPYTRDFRTTDQMCPLRGCELDHCACTQVIDITDVRKGRSIDVVITNSVSYDSERVESSHPIHLHGHNFRVVKVGYPLYKKANTPLGRVYGNTTRDVTCKNTSGLACSKKFITIQRKNRGRPIPIQNVGWRDNQPPNFENKVYIEKDTVIVPFGGYVVIRFIADNPGWWFLHCHIEIHQLEGMAAVIKELNPGEVGSTSSAQSQGTKCLCICMFCIIAFTKM